MGYVFDALNRSADDGSANEPPRLSPQPVEPMCSEPVAQQPTDSLNDSISFADTPPSREYSRVEQPMDQDDLPPLRIEPNSTITGNADDRMILLHSPANTLSEEYRAIRTGLLARWHHKRHLIHTITSATPQEGKTITTLNLGLCLSELQDRRILVVEADLRLPQFRKLLDLPEGPGLTNVLRGEVPVEQTIHTVNETNMDIICAGSRASNDAVQLLSSKKMSSLMNLLRRKYDHVLIDTPPVVELADAGILGAQSDDVLMIVRMERTPKPLVQQAVQTLESYNAPVAGIIATDQHHNRGKYYYYRYGYRYRYRYTERKAA